MNQWQKGKFLYSFIYFIFSKNSAPIGGGGKQCECIRIRTCIHSYVDVCVCGMFSIDAKSHNKHGMFPLVRGSWKKRGGWRISWKSVKIRLSWTPAEIVCFTSPPFFFFLLCIFLFFFFFSLCMGFCCCCYRVIHSGAILTFDPFCFLRVCSRSNFPPPKAPFWNNASLFLFFHPPWKPRLLLFLKTKNP